MHRCLPLLAALVLPGLVAPADAGATPCRDWSPSERRTNPTEAELRCRYGAHGAGRFGLLSYMDLPVYQPATPMPGTHVVGVPGHAGPIAGESYEAWEWRVLRTTYGPAARVARREIELLAGDVAPRIRYLEDLMRQRGIPVRRLESWRAPERQAYLFQQGRSRPGALATGTLTSLHSVVDSLGRPASRAVDYDVPSRQLVAFHELVRVAGLESFGADSNDQGHVFLRDGEAGPEGELALLRVLARVPEVTLATGLPVDAVLPVGGLAVLRRASLDFAREPFIARPAPRLAPAVPSGAMAAVGPVALAVVCDVSPVGSRPVPAASRGAPCAPRRSASPAEGSGGRSTDE